jgi:hypothetical protein
MNQEVQFSFGGVSYSTTSEARNGGAIQLPDGRYLLVDNWTKAIPMQPARLHLVPIPPVGGRIWQAVAKSQITRPTTMDPHDQSRQTPPKAKDLYAGFQRGIVSIYFKKGTDNARVLAILAELEGSAEVSSTWHHLEGDERLTLASATLVDPAGVESFCKSLLAKYPEVAGAHELLPVICWGLSRPAPFSALPAAMAAPMPMHSPSFSGGPNIHPLDPSIQPVDPYAGFHRGLISISFKSGTSNAEIARVLAKAKRYLRYVASAEQPFPKYIKGQDLMRRQAFVNLSDPAKTDKAVAWLLKQPSVRYAAEVLPQICWGFGNPTPE